MIRSSRWRLVFITMVLLSAVLFMAMYMFYSITYRGMEVDSLDALHLSGMRYGLHDEHSPDKGGGDKGPDKPEDFPPDKNRPPIGPAGEATPDGDRGPRDDPNRKSTIPCFVAGYDHDGQLYAEGPGYYDLTDTDYLKSIIEQAREHGAQYGILTEAKLRYLRLDDVCGTGYAFTDVTNEMAILVRLMYQYILIGLLAMAGFFAISVMVSRWAVRPVEMVLQQQRRFIADASHELKTPLTVILTNAELLNSAEYTKEEKGRFSSNILTVSRQMRGLVEQLLDLARMDSSMGNLQMEKLNLSELVDNAVLPFEPMYFEAGRILESRIEPGIRIKGCSQVLPKVVEILLDNGCKYSLPGSTVTLSLSRMGLKKCRITVESRGDAMTAQECRDIFKRFYRRDPSRSMNHSYGLGLSIARTVVRQHKGKIWAESHEGVNTFQILLPMDSKTE